MQTDKAVFVDEAVHVLYSMDKYSSNISLETYWNQLLSNFSNVVVVSAYEIYHICTESLNRLGLEGGSGDL